VPDGVLHTVPFAALPQANGRALVESHSISISPRLDIAHTVPRASPAALVVGDPDFDLQSFAGLPRLPGAAREAAGVAHVYGNRATLLTGADATRETFLRLIPAAGVVHFAGHTVVNDRVPGQSQLVIGSGVRAIDLESLNLSGRPVVVLASCESLRGVETASEGPLGLARSLLRAGSSAVIANYWPVDDEHLSGLMTKFHRLLDQGHAPAEALSAAQRDLLSSDLTLRDRPAHWAGVVAIIGSQPTQHPVTSPGASRQ
jgi:CHAT domain-containing protein